MSKLGLIIDSLSRLARSSRQVFANLTSPGNIKVVAYELARLRSERDRAARAQSPALSSPPLDVLPSLVCSSIDWESEWLPYWAERIGMKPAFHRKLWEFAYIAQVLSAAGKLRPGVHGIGFGCGKEPLASLFAGTGCTVLATDLGADDPRAGAWRNEQHAASFESVWKPALCSHDVALERLAFRSVDMNAIPRDLDGSADFCWSSCALEHVGSIAQGLAFIEASVRCLRPGGVAVHTTELNIDSGKTLDNHPTVLFQLGHFEALAERLAGRGLRMSAIVTRPGDPFLDGYVDVPPYPDPSRVGSTLDVLHLRLLIGAYRTTSVGLVIHGPVAA